MTDEILEDRDLADRMRGKLGGRRDPVAIGVVESGQGRVAVLGASLGSDFEIGSISKGITGLLYVDAIGRGEVTPDTAVGDLLGLGDDPVGRATLAALATHRSGLPRVPRQAQSLRRTFALMARGTNPYPETLPEFIEMARGTVARGSGTRYSNMGFQLLGHAVAAAAGVTFRDLVVDRLVRPTGVEGIYVPYLAHEIRPTAIRGTNRRGRPVDPWVGEAVAPAGGVRATVQAMTGLAIQLLDGSAPGIAALEPVAGMGKGARIGAGWVTLEASGREIVWHNGGTGGFRSWMGLDRERGKAAVVLSGVSRSVDRHGFDLLTT